MPVYNPGPAFTQTSIYNELRNGRPHQGIDFGAPSGTSIPAVASGTVWYSGTGDGYGNVVIVYHGIDSANNQIFSLYAHLRDPSNLHFGDSITYGQPIGLVGSTGTSSGPHLHYGVLQIPPGGPLPAAGTGTSTGLAGNHYWQNPSIFDNYPIGSQDSGQTPQPIDDLPYSFNGIPILEQSVLDFDSAESATPPPISPIVLDLDGDGVETIGVNAGAYFDHDGNGFAESTGWVGADDGLLVWDRNSDGRINDGKELFGSETLLSDGTKAANGYQALSELDSNADGKIDISDAAFASLKVWKDLDGDGYSAASELITLTDAGVQSINTGSTSSTYVDPNGNAHKLTGSFTKTDGMIGATADVWFQTNKLYTIQEEYLTVPADIAALPDLRGYGNVYDLSQAMVRDTTGSLKSLVEQFIAESNPGNRNTLLDQMLFKWTGSDGIDPASRGGSIDARKLSVMEKFYGRDFTGVSGPNPNAQAAALLNQSYQGLSELFYAPLMAQTHFKSYYDQITYSWDSVSQSIRGDSGAVTASLQAQLTADPKGGRLLLSEFARTVKGLSAQQTLGYTAFRDGFAAQGTELGIILDAAGAYTRHGTTGIDNLGLSGAGYVIWGYSGDDVLTLQAPREGIGSPSQRNLFDGGTGNDRYYSGITTDTYVFNRGDGQDLVNDYDTGLLGATDTISFGAGIAPADIVLSRTADSLVLAVTDPLNSAAADRITIENWFYHPYYNIEAVTFADGTVWGAGDLRARLAPYTTYAYSRGTGLQTIYDYDWAQSGVDTVALGAGIVSSDVQLQRVGTDLVIVVSDPANIATNDRITLQHWFANPVYSLNTIAFADGTFWDTATLRTKLTTGTEGADTLLGWQDLALTYNALGGDDTINAQVANDIINAGDGNDRITDTGGSNTIDAGTGNDWVWVEGNGVNTISGGAGNDTVQTSFNANSTLDGGAGDDYLLVWRTGGNPLTHNTLIGGLGNDQLFGSASADTYLFNRGDGADTVNDYDYGVQGAMDTIAFGAGIVQSDLSLIRSGDHLVIKIADPGNPASNDQITIQWWYLDPAHNRIERFTFADSSVLTGAGIDTLPLTVEGTAAGDSLSGGAGNDTLNGYGGNDSLTDMAGNNILNGGDGDDALTAGTGNDTFMGGAGADSVTDDGGDNTIDSGAGNDYVLIHNGTGTNIINTGDGDDTVQASYNADNTLNGGTGNDFLLVDRTGGSPLYHNTFIGGLGNDQLFGSASTDTYLFNRGDGSDTVNDYDYGAQGANDTLSFGTGINPLDLVFSRNGDHLKLSVHNSTDSVNVQWWYAAPSHHHVETVRAGNGSTLVDSRVDQLIQAMATFSAQNGGISWDQAIDQRPNDVQAILAANWMPAG